MSGAAGAPDAFDRAVEIVVSGELSKHGKMEVKKTLDRWEINGGFGLGEEHLFHAHNELATLGLSDADTARLIGLCDYLIAEHMELAGNAQRDDRSAFARSMPLHARCT
jgi:hypothetical protein